MAENIDFIEHNGKKVSRNQYLEQLDSARLKYEQDLMNAGYGPKKRKQALAEWDRGRDLIASGQMSIAEDGRLTANDGSWINATDGHDYVGMSTKYMKDTFDKMDNYKDPNQKAFKDQNVQDFIKNQFFGGNDPTEEQKQALYNSWRRNGYTSLADAMESYRQSHLNDDFEGSIYQNSDDFNNKMNAFITNLRNGKINDDDVNSASSVGLVWNDLTKSSADLEREEYNKAFRKNYNAEWQRDAILQMKQQGLTDKQISAKLNAMRRQRFNTNQAEIDQINVDNANDLVRRNWIPFANQRYGRGAAPVQRFQYSIGKANRNIEQYEKYMLDHNFNPEYALNGWLSNPQKYRQQLSNGLDYLTTKYEQIGQSNTLSNIGQGQYLINSSVDFNNGTALVFDKSRGTVRNITAGESPVLQQILYNMYQTYYPQRSLQDNGIAWRKDGGQIEKFQQGGPFSPEEVMTAMQQGVISEDEGNAYLQYLYHDNEAVNSIINQGNIGLQTFDPKTSDVFGNPIQHQPMDLLSSLKLEQEAKNEADLETKKEHARKLGYQVDPTEYDEHAGEKGMKQYEASQRKLSKNTNDNWDLAEFKAEDYARLFGMAADITGLIASFTGVGNIANVGTGLTSTAANLFADVKDDSVTKGQVWSNVLTNAGLSVVGVIPGGNAPKIIKTALKFGPKVFALYNAAGLAMDDEVRKSWEKCLHDGENAQLTVQDWKNIAHSITALRGLAGAGNDLVNQHRFNKTAGKQAIANKNAVPKEVTVETSTGQQVKLNEAQLKAINEAGKSGGKEGATKAQQAFQKLKDLRGVNNEEITLAENETFLGNPFKDSRIAWNSRRGLKPETPGFFGKQWDKLSGTKEYEYSKSGIAKLKEQDANAWYNNPQLKQNAAWAWIADRSNKQQYLKSLGDIKFIGSTKPSETKPTENSTSDATSKQSSEEILERKQKQFDVETSRGDNSELNNKWTRNWNKISDSKLKEASETAINKGKVSIVNQDKFKAFVSELRKNNQMHLLENPRWMKLAKEQYKFRNGGSFLQDSTEAFKKGGIFKFQAGTNSKWTDPNSQWYRDRYKQQSLTGWNNTLNQQHAGPTITDSGKHYNAGSLEGSYNTNQAYTSNKDTVRNDLQGYYNSDFSGKSAEDFVNGYNTNAEKIRSRWSQDQTYNTTGARDHNQLYRKMFASRSGDGKNAWDLGYQDSQDDIQGSTTWMRRMDQYKDEFDTLSNEDKLNRIHEIDLGNGNRARVAKLANGNIGLVDENNNLIQNQNGNPSEEVTSLTNISLDGARGANIPKTYWGQLKDRFSKFNWQQSLLDTAPALRYADAMRTNKKNLPLARVTPTLIDASQTNPRLKDDLIANQWYNGKASELQFLNKKSNSSDATANTNRAFAIDEKALELQNKGRLESSNVRKESSDQAYKEQMANEANLVDVGNKNNIAGGNAREANDQIQIMFNNKNFDNRDKFRAELINRLNTNLNQSKMAALEKLQYTTPGLAEDPEYINLYNQSLEAINNNDTKKANEIEMKLNELQRNYMSDITNRRWDIISGRKLYAKSGGELTPEKAKVERAKIAQKDKELFLKALKNSTDNSTKKELHMSRGIQKLILNALQSK